MKTLKACGLVLTLSMTSATAQTATNQGSGEWLKFVCSSEPSTPTDLAGKETFHAIYQRQNWECYGFVIGWRQAAMNAHDRNLNAVENIVPDGVTNEQFRLVIDKYLNKHPENLQLSGDSLMTRIIVDAWSKGGPK